MNNIEFKNKVISELPGYQIGLHQVNEDSYRHAVAFDDESPVFFGKIMASRKEIADNILQKGLIIIDDKRGPLSTITFLGSDSSNDFASSEFDYSYYPFKSNEDLESLVIVIAIPSYINVSDNDIFLGDLHMKYNIGNNILFRKGIPKEFIYGYYHKGVMPINNKGLDVVHHFDKGIYFQENPAHISHMSIEERNLFLANFVRNSDIRLSSFNLVNRKVGRLALQITNYGRIIIETKEQEKKFILRF